jgi:hypothetical protein
VNRKLPLINHLTVLHYVGLADYWLTPFTKVVCLGEPFLYFRFRHTFRQMRPTTQVSASYQDYYSFIWWPGAICPSESWLHTGIVALAAVYMLATPCSMIAICCSLVLRRERNVSFCRFAGGFLGNCRAKGSQRRFKS